MATDVRNLPAFLSGDADFRTWAQGIAAQIAAMGLVKTADTGQINLATVLRPAANAFAGYEVYRFADALQATAPVFIKVEYGVGGSVDMPNLAVTVGTATNGAGVLTGQVGARRVLTPGTSKTAGAVLPSYCSGSTSRLSLATNLDASNYPFHMSSFVERPKDGAGANQADSIMALFGCSYGTIAHQIIPFVGTIPGVSSGPSVPPIRSGKSAGGSDVALAPHFIWTGGKLLYASLLSYREVDIPELATFAVTYLGAARTYLPLGDGTNGEEAGENVLRVAMPWE